jgi:hypothetical protein
MKGKIAVVLLSGLLFACAPMQPPQTASAPPPPPPPPPPAPAAVAAPPADRIVAIRRATCERLLQLSNEDRATASMFYIGYQASRFGSRTINVAVLAPILALTIGYCQANPDRPAADAFAAAYAAYTRYPW